MVTATVLFLHQRGPNHRKEGIYTIVKRWSKDVAVRVMNHQGRKHIYDQGNCNQSTGDTYYWSADRFDSLLMPDLDLLAP